MKNIFPILLIIAGLGLLAGLIWVGYSQREEAGPVAEQQVAATIFPLGDMLENVAGEAVEVVTILPPGASPHTFEPTVGTVQDVSGSKLIFSVGAGMDEWAETLGESAGVEVLELADSGVQLIEEEEEEGHEDEPEDDGHGHEGANPHYWLSIPNAIQLVEEMTDQLGTQFPAHKAVFEANATTYIAELTIVDTEIRAQLAGVENVNLVTFHDSYPYFAEEYGLTVVGSFEPSAGKEPTPQYLKELQEATKEAEVSVVYSEPQLGTAQLEPFVEDLGLTIAILDPIGGIEGRLSYIELMRYNAQVIADNQ